MTTPTLEGLTPDLFGYVRCVLCRVWRPVAATVPWGVGDHACVDAAWCARQSAAVPTGLDANGDAT